MGSHLSACVRPAAPGGAGYGSVCAAEGRTMGVIFFWGALASTTYPLK